MQGYDDQVLTALHAFSELPILQNFCMVYEFGGGVNRIGRPMASICGDVLSTYQLTPAGGQTPLFEAMDRSYSDVLKADNIWVIVIISDGHPHRQAYRNHSPVLQESAHLCSVGW